MVIAYSLKALTEVGAIAIPSLILCGAYPFCSPPNPLHANTRCHKI